MSLSHVTFFLINFKLALPTPGCSAEYSEDADELGGSCYKTVIPADVYYSGDDIAGIVARIQDAIDGHEWNVPGLMKVSPVDRDNGGVSAIQQNRSEEEDDKIGPAGFLAVAAAALVLLLLAVMVARRRRRDEIVKHVELGDDDDTYLKDMEADSQGSSPSRVARVVGEDDSVGTGWASSRAGDFPMDGYFTNLESRPSHQDVHVCSSATCDVCESRRRAGIQFVPTGTPSIKHPPMPPDSPRQYAADDTVCL